MQQCPVGETKKGMTCHGAAGGAYGWGLIGALVYYIQHADTFWVGALGVLKALVWSVFLVDKFLEFFKMQKFKNYLLTNFG